MDKKISNRIFLILLAVYVFLAAASTFLPQHISGANIPVDQMPASPVVMALANAGIVLVIYGGLGTAGLLLVRKLGLPDIWDATVSNRQRFLIPALVGVGVGAVFIIGDLVFSPVNGIGRITHPPFPTSIVAAITAGIGEEMLFRLFFISFWTWLVSRLLLRGRGQTPVYAAISFLSAIVFALSHLPSLMFLYGWTDFSQIPTMLLVEIVLLNGVMALFCAYTFKKSGFLAPVGIHFWADVVWHVLWGVL